MAEKKDENAQPIIGFDLDEVLCNLRDGTMAALRRRHGYYPHWSEWTTFGHNRAHGVSDEEYLRIIVEERILEAAALEPFAREVIDDCHRLGFRTAVITARGYHPRGEEVTREWLDRHALKIDELRIVKFGESKVDVIRALGPVRAYIDDNADHIDALYAAGVGGDLRMISRPWNADVDAFYRLKDLNWFGHHICSLVSDDVLETMDAIEAGEITRH